MCNEGTLVPRSLKVNFILPSFLTALFNPVLYSAFCFHAAKTLKVSICFYAGVFVEKWLQTLPDKDKHRDRIYWHSSVLTMNVEVLSLLPGV